MSKYRAVLMVPTIVEFETPLNDYHVTKQARQIAGRMGTAKSEVRKLTYIPTVMEVARQGGETTDLPPNNLEIRNELDPEAA